MDKARSLRIIHIASFSGNIGDNANHAGFRSWFEPLFDGQIEWFQVEIREFYWKQRKFDRGFVDQINSYDLCVIGGGNYFELWVEESPSGTSIAFSPEDFAAIRIPVFFNALGVDLGQGATSETIKRFNAFMQIVLADAKNLVSIRNDGARAALEKIVPARLSEKILDVPDGGFFADFKASHLPVSSNATVIGVNVASDMPEVRFSKISKGYTGFCEQLGRTLVDYVEVEPTASFLFFPHIFRDLQIISDVIQTLPDPVRRRRVSVAPYLTGDQGAAFVFGLYLKCVMILGMRFHANVFPIGRGIPVIGMNCYPQIEYLFQEIEYHEGKIDLHNGDFRHVLLERMKFVRINRPLIVNELSLIRHNLYQRLEEFVSHVRLWASRNGLV